MLWGISWFNVQLMLHDAARIKDEPADKDSGSGEVVHKELKTKEDIKNHLKGLM